MGVCAETWHRRRLGKVLGFPGLVVDVHVELTEPSSRQPWCRLPRRKPTHVMRMCGCGARTCAGMDLDSCAKTASSACKTLGRTPTWRWQRDLLLSLMYTMVTIVVFMGVYYSLYHADSAASAVAEGGGAEVTPVCRR